VHVARILFSKNATVYTAARNPDLAAKINADIAKRYPTSNGRLVYLKLDLADLRSVKAAAQEFLSKETHLDYLCHNAAVMQPPTGSRSAQGWDLQLGVNTLGPFLLTKLLTPTLVATAKIRSPGSVRVMFVSSSAAYLFTPVGGVDMSEIKEKNTTLGGNDMYSATKAGNALHALHFKKLYGKDGVVAVVSSSAAPLTEPADEVAQQAGNPGNLNSDLPRHMSWWARLLMRPLQYDSVYGAYTELYGGLSPDITLEHNGAWLKPWGRIGTLRHDIALGGKSKDEGGTGLAEEYWQWCEEQVRDYV
jgi:retinol dehydrogenase 12